MPCEVCQSPLHEAPACPEQQPPIRSMTECATCHGSIVTVGARAWCARPREEGGCGAFYLRVANTWTRA